MVHWEIREERTEKSNQISARAFTYAQTYCREEVQMYLKKIYSVFRKSVVL